MVLKTIYGEKKIPAAEKAKVVREARARAASFGTDEVAYVANPSYVYPAHEIYPLARKQTRPLREILGIVKDMDGTTTTTETLCLHSLDFMVRRITDRMDPKKWSGIDRTIDYPHIIGNSTTKHVEYLIATYQRFIQGDALKRAYGFAVLWTLRYGQDEKRREEVCSTLRSFHIPVDEIERMAKGLSSAPSERQLEQAARRFAARHGRNVPLNDFTMTVRIAIDVYYQRYHEILGKISQGRGKELTHLTGGQRLISPMPGVGIYLSLVKGWLGSEAVKVYPIISSYLKHHPRVKLSETVITQQRRSFARLGPYFARHPVKVAVVTSSIAYEARIVLNEVFRVLKEEVRTWPISTARKARIREKFSRYDLTYDGFVTATDSSEIRLKPHRDLYNIAVHELGVPRSKLRSVVGFEDSESGLLAIRAAGIGKSAAVPFADTEGHDLSSASVILYGGLPEAMVRYLAFLDPKVLGR